jgi:hypothetical protein
MPKPIIQFERSNEYWRALMRYRGHRLSCEGVSALAAAEGLKCVLNWQALTGISAEDLQPMEMQVTAVIESLRDPDRSSRGVTSPPS